MAIHWQASCNGGSLHRVWVETQPGFVLEVVECQEVVHGLRWLSEDRAFVFALSSGGIQSQLQRYFTYPRHVFECRLALRGTPFQRRVWQRLVTIPLGQTKTYGELAAELGSSPRAVAGACRANPFPVIVPCHRVVSKSGVGGYCGQATGEMPVLKRWLLEHECDHG